MGVFQSMEPTPNESKTKKIFLRMAVLFVILSFIGGFIGAYIFITQYSYQTVNQANAILQDKSGNPVDAFTGARNTFIVQAVDKVAPAIVGITTKVYNRDFFNRRVLVGEGVGSGIIFNNQGYIVTNYHVVKDTNNNEVTVSLANGESVPGIVVGSDPQTDLAVVKIKPFQGMSIAQFGNSASLKVGEPAIAIGNPLGLELQGSVSVGIISALHRTIDTEGSQLPLIQTDAAINPGNSGGALVNANGYVIGINSAKIMKNGIEGLGFAIPINEAKPIIESLITTGKVLRPHLGLWCIDTQTAAQYGESLPQKGLLIVKLNSSGSAAQAGLTVGDIIMSINGVNVPSMKAFRSNMHQYQPGDTIEITYYRNGQVLQTNVTLS